jgi:phosphoglucosamine mutase
VIAEMARSATSLAELAGVMTKFPQVLVNVPGVDKTRCDTDPQVAAAVVAAADELGDSGRVLLRPSGTESLVRVMVEAGSESQARAVADRLAAVVARALSL